MAPRFVARFPAVALIAFSTACSGTGQNAPAVPPVTPQSISSSILGKRVVYVAAHNQNEVFEIPAGVLHPTPRVAITDGINGPSGLAVDGFQTLYVLNWDSAVSNITEYPKGAVHPSLTIPLAQYQCPCAIGAGPDGTLYLASGLDGQYIEKFARGSDVPVFVANDPSQGQSPQVQAILADQQGDIFASYTDIGPEVAELSPGQNWVNLAHTRNFGGGMSFDGNGGLLVSQNWGRHGAIRDITGNQYSTYVSPRPNQMTYDRPDSLVYIATNSEGLGPSVLKIFDRKARRTVSVVKGITNVDAVVVSPTIF